MKKEIFSIDELKRVRIVGLDLDGTALTNDKRITLRTRNAIEAASHRGILVMSATGRPVTGIPKAFTDIPGIRYLLGSNGAAVYDRLESRFVVHECLDRETALQAMELYAAADCSFELYMDGIPYIGKADFERIEYLIPDPFICAYVKNTRVIVPDIRAFLMQETRGIEKINMSYPTVEAKDFGVSLLKELPQVTGVCGLPTNLELAKRGVDKGEGLLKFAAFLGISGEAVLACGDSENDLAMIQKAGIGVAMANGSEEVKQAADFVLPYTNEEEGVAWLLEQLVLLDDERLDLHMNCQNII